MTKILLTAAVLASMTTSALANDEAKPFKGIMTGQAEKLGFDSCLPAIAAIDKFLNQNVVDYGTWTTTSNAAPDKHLLSAMNLQVLQDGSIMITTIAVGKSGEGDCDGSLTSVYTHVNSTCGAVREKIYSNYEYMDDVAGQPLYGTGSTKLSLIQVGNNCQAVRQETLFPVPQ